MANGVDQVGLKGRDSRLMLLVLILMRHVMMRLIVRVDHMTKTAHIQKDVVQKRIEN